MHLTSETETRVRFPALPDFLRSVSGTGSTQPREYNWGAALKKSSDSGLEIEITAVGLRHAEHVARFIHKSWH
jgi:hypothetical protein